MKLREYQRDMLRQIGNSFNGGCQSVMFQMTTGAGKTAIAAHWASGKTLFLCHSLSVIGQAPAEFAKWGVRAVPVGSGYRKWQDALATLQLRSGIVASTAITAANNLDDLSRFAAVIVDEAHHAPDGKTRANRVITRARELGLPVLGMTATPWRMSKRQGFSQTWDTLILGPSWNDLRGKYLADIRMVRAEGVIRGAGATSGLDYKEGATYQRNADVPIFTRGAIGMVPDKKTIMYAVGQRHAVNLARLAAKRGISAGILISDKSLLKDLQVETDPVEVNRRFRNGELQLIINVNMITEGYDLPDCECVIVLRPTKSLALWLQMCGRGSRLAAGKDKLTLIDLTDNHERLGDPLMERSWSLKPRSSDNALGEPVLRVCDNRGRTCRNFIYAAAQTCPHCGAPQGAICAICGKWRHWHRLEGNLCDRCQHERPRHVKVIYPGWTRRGDRYYVLRLDDGSRANLFPWQRGYALVDIEYRSKVPCAAGDVRPYRNIEVELQKKGRWQNVKAAWITK